MRPGSEEYLDSEKYQLRQWDLDRARQPGPAARPAEPHPPRAAGARPPAHAALPQHRQRRRCCATRRPTRPAPGRPCSSSSTSTPTSASRAASTSTWPPLGLPYESSLRASSTSSTDAPLPLARRVELRRARPVGPRPTSSVRRRRCMSRGQRAAAVHRRRRRRRRRAGRLVPRRGHLRAPRPGLRRLQRRRHRRLQRARPAPRLPRRPRRHGDLAAAVLPVAAARRRLRHRRLPHRPPRLRRPAPVPALPRRRPRPQHPRDHRARRQPHVRPAPLVPAGPQGAARLDRARLLRVERHHRPLRRRPHHLPGLRAVELDVGPGRRGVLLAPLLLPPARPQLRQPRRRGGHLRRPRLLARRWASTVCASTPCRTCSSARAPTARTCPRPTTS